MEAADHVLMEHDGTLLLYVNDGAQHDAAADANDVTDVTTVMLNEYFVHYVMWRNVKHEFI